MLKDIKPGDVFPDFELPDENGILHKLSDLQGANPMVVLLGRGEHCPRERQHQREMLKFHEWCATLEGELVTIVPNNLHDTLKLRMSTGAHWTYLADADLEVQRTLGIEEYVDTHHTATVPHTVVLAPGLLVEKVYVGFWFWGRPTPYDLWADLRAVREKHDWNFDPTTTEVRKEYERRRPQLAERSRARAAKQAKRKVAAPA
jgi:peroxiredoxin